MKSIIRPLIVSVLLLLAHPAPAIIGYVNRTFGIGDSLFTNPLQASPNNTLSNLFQSYIVPNNTKISLWNSASGIFDSTFTYDPFFGWVDDNFDSFDNFILNPGTGVRLTAPSAFTNTFFGTVLNHDGSVLSGSLTFTPPPLFGGPNGIHLLGDKAPISINTGADIFLNLVGRAPNIGEQVITLTSTSTYLGGGSWDNIPTMAVSDAVFLNIGPVPEPASLSLTLIGFALIPIYRRLQR